MNASLHDASLDRLQNTEGATKMISSPDTNASYPLIPPTVYSVSHKMCWSISDQGSMYLTWLKSIGTGVNRLGRRFAGL